jgi:type I restriction-modification system DNA methylase subunit
LLDPACGTAGLLTEAYAYIKNNNPNNTIDLTGIERNAAIATLGKMNLLLNEISSDNLRIRDVFTQVDFKELDRSFDYVICNPPVGRTPHDNEFLTLQNAISLRYGPPVRSREVNSIQLCVSALKPGGAGVLLVPLRFLFSSGTDARLPGRVGPAEDLDYLREAFDLAAILGLKARFLALKTRL